jgi:hypothetical protein
VSFVDFFIAPSADNINALETLLTIIKEKRKDPEEKTHWPDM